MSTLATPYKRVHWRVLNRHTNRISNQFHFLAHHLDYGSNLSVVVVDLLAVRVPTVHLWFCCAMGQRWVVRRPLPRAQTCARWPGAWHGLQTLCHLWCQAPCRQDTHPSCTTSLHSTSTTATICQWWWLTCWQ